MRLTKGRCGRRPCGIALAAVLAMGVMAVWGVELTEGERGALDDALSAMNAGVSDLGFKKDVMEPRSALGWIREALEAPMKLNSVGAELWGCARGDDSAGWWKFAAKRLEAGDLLDTLVGFDVAVPAWDGASEDLARALSAFFVQAALADAMLERAFAGLAEFELQYLAASTLAGGFNLEDEETSRAAFRAAGISQMALERVLEEGKALDARPAGEAYLDAALKVDRSAVLSAGRIFQRAVYSFADAARKISEWPDAAMKWDTPLGAIVIAVGDGAVVSNAALLVVNPAGATVYGGEAGVANGLVGRRLAAIVDLGGDDVYRSEGLLGAGAALFGVSVVLDVAGDDRWRAEYVGQGAGFFGSGWVEDGAGDDVFEARVFGQGVGVAGVGVLLDGAGDDSYRVGWQGQGFAGWMGLGVLLDRAGRDRYFAGGQELDHERNPDHYLSLAQGFSIGSRPFAGGGVGALIDLGGDDVYEAEVFGQGASYYYSAGFLLDGGGDDRYVTLHYGQGCGVHLSLGLLADLAGDDVYVGGTLAQGAAHDFSVAGLLDRAGDDRYEANRNAQGHGMNNAVGWLVDSAGDDEYSGADVGTTQGVGNEGGSRESGSIGLLLDLGGRDRYSGPGADDRVVLRPLYGVVFDRRGEGGEGTEAQRHKGTEAQRHIGTEAQRDKGTKGGADDDGGQKEEGEGVLDYEGLLYRALRYGNTEQRRVEKEEARQELFAAGGDALREVMARAHYENVMMQVFAFELVSGHVPAEEGVPVLAESLVSEHEQTRKVAAYLLGFYPRVEGQIPALMAMLDMEKERGAALRTLGKWRVEEVRPIARGLLKEESERIRIAACNALGEFADAEDVSALIEALGDPALLVRNTAARAVLKQGEAARVLLEETLAKSDGVKRRQIEQVLSVLRGAWEWELPYY